MFNLQSNGSCTPKCIAGKEQWNNKTKVCDQIRQFNLTVTPSLKKIMRCRNTTITTLGGGFLASEQPIYTWSYEVISGGVNKDKWVSEINSLIANANGNKSLTITIPSTLSEKIFDNTTFRFTV